ncbi:MAG: low temperature requirement protein A [Candidatus Dormibacteraeota bacterium]|jgi:low temperature requirement protein LtrA|nr:low temperature requirement protein A [Candidatus Dormibacteraeota bacterium]
MSPAEPLSTPANAPEAVLRVTTLELFFDLVFVFAVTQLTGVLVRELSPLGLFRVVVMFGVLWWMYGGYAWLTNTMAPTRWSRRVLLLVGMAGFMVVALATPRAFEGDGVAWGVGYLVVVLVHAGLYVQSNRNILRILPFNLLAAGLVIVAGVLHGPAVYALWTVALVVPIATPYLVHSGRFEIQPSHMVERYGLALLITLGESVVAVGIGVSGEPLNLGVLGAVVLGLALAAALWWTYFGGDDERVEQVLLKADPRQRGPLTIAGFFYATIPMVLGIVTTAAGLKLSVGHLGNALPLGPAVALAGGTTLFLGGAAALRRAFRIGPIRVRVGGALLALPAILLGTRVSATAELVALVLLLAAVLVLERIRDLDSTQPA